MTPENVGTMFVVQCAQAAKQAPHDSIAFCLTPLASGLCCHVLRLETFERDNFERVDRISELQQLQDTPTCVHAQARGSGDQSVKVVKVRFGYGLYIIHIYTTFT